MFKFKNFTTVFSVLFITFISSKSYSDNHNIYEVLDLIRKDIKTLEKAVYSGSLNNSLNNSNSEAAEIDANSEEVLTRHLLKLSEIENQFQELTNKFEEINFKLDKLSSRLSKVQADNQIRFQQLEDKTIVSDNQNTNVTSITKKEEKSEILPGSSQPQDLGTISYKDTETNLSTQQTQSIDSTNAVITETFASEEKLLPEVSPEKQYEFAFLGFPLKLRGATGAPMPAYAVPLKS